MTLSATEFLKRTHIDPDYFLLFVLETLNIISDEDSLSKHKEGIMFGKDQRGVDTLVVEWKNQSIQIRKPK